MLSIRGSHNQSQIFCDVVILPVERLDGLGQDDPHYARNLDLQVLKALIDTGATNTCLTEVAAKKLGLEPLGFIPTMGVHGTNFTRFYLFRIGFVTHSSNEFDGKVNQMSVLQDPIQGTELGFDTAPFDVLLGMDVISKGDLHVKGSGAYEFHFHNEQNACY